MAGGGGGSGGPIGLSSEQWGAIIIDSNPGLLLQTDNAPCLAGELEFTDLGDNAVHLLKRTVEVINPRAKGWSRNTVSRMCARTCCEVVCDLSISSSRAELEQADLQTGPRASLYCMDRDTTLKKSDVET